MGNDPEGRFLGIEICRFFCSVSVVLYHYQHFFETGCWSVGEEGPRQSFPLYWVLAPFYQQGSRAVWLFWAISGFIFFWKYAASIHSGALDGGRFFAWRFARLYPLHLLTLGVVFVLQAVYMRGHDEAFIYPVDSLYLQLLMASNWSMAFAKTFNGPIWSVSVEVLVYALFFMTTRILRPGLGARASIAVVAGVIFVSAISIYFSDLLYCVILFFAGGAVQALIASLDKEARKKAFWIAVCVAALSALAAFSFGAARAFGHDGAVPIISFSLATVAAFALVAEAVPLDLTRFARLGDLTYGSYLWHFPIQLVFVLVVDGLGWQRTIFLSPIPLLLWLGATFALAAASSVWFERPAQRMIRTVYLMCQANGSSVHV